MYVNSKPKVWTFIQTQGITYLLKFTERLGDLTVVSEHHTVVVVDGFQLIAVRATDSPVDVPGGITIRRSTLQNEVAAYRRPMDLCIRHRRKRVKNYTGTDKGDVAGMLRRR